MAKVLSKTGIVTGNEVEAWHVTQSIDAFTGVEAYDITISGSFTLTGSLNLDGNLVGETTGTSSFADYADYTLFSLQTDVANTASYNDTDYFKIQFYHYPVNLGEGTGYKLGAGEDITVSNVGITLPIDVTLASVDVMVVTEKTGSGEQATWDLYTLNQGLITTLERTTYDKRYSNFPTDLGYDIDKNDPIYFTFSTPFWGTKPFQTSHTVVLTCKPK